MNDEIISLDLGEASSVQYRIHPLVPLEVCDFSYRQGRDFVIGSIYGTVSTNRIDITYCYGITSSLEDGETIIDKEAQTRFNEMHKRLYPKEVLLGWFTTKKAIDYECAALNLFFSSKEAGFAPEQGILTQPLLLQVDPTLSKLSFGVKAYASVSMTFCKNSFAVFQAVAAKVEFTSQDQQKFRAVLGAGKHKSEDETESVDKQLDSVVANLGTLEKFLKEVKDNKKGKDPKMAKKIKQLLNVGLEISDEEKRSLIAKNSQDILMISYLCDLVSTQGVVQDKLNKFILGASK